MEQLCSEEEVLGLAKTIEDYNREIYGVEANRAVSHYEPQNCFFLTKWFKDDLKADGIDTSQYEHQFESIEKDIVQSGELGFLNGFKYCETMFCKKGFEYPKFNDITDIDCMCVFNFGDNDFGGYFEDIAEEFCTLYNRQVKLIEDSQESRLEYDKENVSRLHRMFSFEFISSFIYGLFPNDTILPSWGSIDVKDYLKIKNTEYYSFGKKKEIIEKLWTENKDSQSKENFEKWRDIEHLWLNGEFLIIYVDHGIADWVRK